MFRVKKAHVRRWEDGEASALQVSPALVRLLLPPLLAVLHLSVSLRRYQRSHPLIAREDETMALPALISNTQHIR